MLNFVALLIKTSRISLQPDLLLLVLLVEEDLVVVLVLQGLEKRLRSQGTLLLLLVFVSHRVLLGRGGVHQGGAGRGPAADQGGRRGRHQAG